MKKQFLAILPLILTACLGGGSGGGNTASPTKSIAPSEPVTETPVDSTPTTTTTTLPTSSTPTDPPATTTTQPPATTTTTLPASLLSQVNGKSYTMASGGIQITSTQVIDSRCGGTYNITSSVESSGVLTVEADLVTASYAYPGNNDCMVTTDQRQVWTNGSTCSGIRANLQLIEVAYKITYSISSISGGIAVSRDLTSKRYLIYCTSDPINNGYMYFYGNVAEENYFE